MSGKISGEIYEKILASAKETEERRKKSKILSRGKDIQLVQTRQNYHCYYVAQGLGFETYLVLFKAQIPEGKHSGKHRHMSQAIIYILKGKGHSIVEDQRYDWEEGDSVFVPSFLWHQHFNDGKGPIEYLGFGAPTLLMNLGLENLEQGEVFEG